MGKKQEISTEQDFDVFKILYTSSCKEAGIGLQNKAAALHALIQKLSENPDDDKIKDLFFQTLADLELLCTNFHDYSNYEVAEEYEELLNRYAALKGFYGQQEQFEDAFSDYKDRTGITFIMNSVDAVSQACDGTCKEESDGTENARQGTEVEQLSALFRNILGMEDCNSSLLEVHLRSFLAQIDADEMLSVLKPFLVWQLMIRRQEALAEKQELSVTLGELLAYETYPVRVEQKKVRKQLKAYTKLFRKICKYYKKDEKADKAFSRYALVQTTNLAVFAAEEQFDKLDKICPPFLSLVLDMDLSCLDSEAPEEWQAEELFGVKEEDADRYAEYEPEENMEYTYEMWAIEEKTEAYLSEHPALLDAFREAFYLDMDKSRNVAEQIFAAICPAPDGSHTWLTDCVKAQIFDTVTEKLDNATEKEVLQLCLKL